MFVDIYLTDTETGESRTYHDKFDWQEAAAELSFAEGAVIYQYTEGNYSCDCNRSLFFYDWEEDKVKPCGNTIRLDKIVNRETDKLIWNPEQQAQDDIKIRLRLQYGLHFI